MALTFFRWLFASLLLAPFAIAPLYRQRAVVRAHWKKLALLGAVGIGLHNALAYVGLNYTTATNGVILNSTIPVMIIALSWFVTGRMLARTALVGVALSLCGVLVMVHPGDLPFGGSPLVYPAQARTRPSARAQAIVRSKVSATGR